MSAIAELGAIVRTRRTDIGLTQAAVAALSGLSRATINQLEQGGSTTDLSLNRAVRLLESLGLGLDFVSHQHSRGGRSPALEIAARTASVSYRKPIQAQQLRHILQSGELPSAFLPHLNTLLDEAPVSLLAQVVEQLHVEEGVERPRLWQQMRALARQMKSSRGLWQ